MKDPQDASVLSARLAKAFPSLSAYSAATLAEALCAIERAQRRHAERCCSGEDGGYVKRKEGAPVGLGVYTKHVLEHDPEAEERADKRIRARAMKWRDMLRQRLLDVAAESADALLQRTAELQTVAVVLQHDPRGPVLLLKLPNESEAVAV